MDIDKFVSLVERMREAQTTYFKTKNRNVLQRSIILEGLCDKEIAAYNEEKKSMVIEPDLFSSCK